MAFDYVVVTIVNEYILYSQPLYELAVALIKDLELTNVKIMKRYLP